MDYLLTVVNFSFNGISFRLHSFWAIAIYVLAQAIYFLDFLPVDRIFHLKCKIEGIEKKVI